MNAIQQQQVKLQNVNMQGDKLYIRGEAPSDQAKNKVWDEIKRIDPGYSDLTCDITVQSSQPQTMSAGAATSGGQQTRHYTVKPGDSLSKIAKQFYGSAADYMKIFEANRNILHDPDKVSAGQELVIPE